MFVVVPPVFIFFIFDMPTYNNILRIKKSINDTKKI